MRVREPSADDFYPRDCAAAIERFVGSYSPPEFARQPVAAVVPHAGWQYSGAVAAKVFQCIKRSTDPQTFVLLGAVHRWVGINGVDPEGGWATPLGVAAIDEDLANRVLDHAGSFLTIAPHAHRGEHSIEVEIPFIQYFFPEAKFVPIAVNPDARAVPLGAALADVLQGYERRTFIVGSTDLTHYGEPYHFSPAGYGETAREWMRRNDARIIGYAEGMQEQEIIGEAAQHHNACGAGALAATVAAAKALGSDAGRLIEYTTSFDVVPDPPFRMAVGYAGMIF
jgi:MEMO1 family protein